MTTNRFVRFKALFLVLVLSFSCSTEKDAALNRWFHQTNTKYNGYFNANELIKEALNNYYQTRKEDFSALLPIEALPDETEAQAMYAALDTAVSKCTKVIAKHSMPSIETGKKTEEYNKWMDEVWLTIGRSKYIKREYEGAFKNFKYITKFFKHDGAKFWGNLWQVKTHMQVGEIRDAEMLIKQIDRDLDGLESQEKGKGEDSKSSSKSKKHHSKSKIIRNQNKKNEAAEGGGKPIKLSKNFKYELLKVKADIAIYNKKYDEAQKFLEDAMKERKSKNRKERARMYFILAQLAVINGDNAKGIHHYTSVLKNQAKYDMYFAARLNRAMASGAIGSLKVRKELNKMLRDEKNFEFKDQIYYALGDIEMSAGNKDIAMANFTRSVFYSINNERQKSMSYERMADVCFNDKNYVNAQKYYDSCAQVMPESYRHFDLVKNKAEKLKDLVVAVETVAREDSLQKLAQLSPDEQRQAAEKKIKQIQEEKKRQAELQAQRLEQLQALQNQQNQGIGGSKWYFYDTKQRDKGFETFKSVWGQRVLEDDWRRSNKIVQAKFNEETGDTTAAPTDSVAPKEDSLTADMLLAAIPQGDSAIAASKSRLMSALYESGRIYETELNEKDLAIKQFKNLLERKIESPTNLLAIYELYKIYQPNSPSESDYYKSLILNDYPNSDFANYIRDPDYFIKQKKREAIDLEDLEKTIERYRMGMYGLVSAKSNMVITNDPENAYLSKYMLLHAMARGQSLEDKNELIPELEAITSKFPNSDEAKKAAEMIDIIKNGYSKEVKLDFGKSSEFDYNPTDELFYIIMLDKNSNLNEIKSNLSNFNNEYFSTNHLKTQGSQLSADQPIIIIRKFEDEVKAKKYTSALEKTKKYELDKLKPFQQFLISGKNYAKLITSNNLKGYLSFYKDFYK